MRRLARQPRLADAGRPGKIDSAAGQPRGLDRAQLVLASGERRPLGQQRGRVHCRRTDRTRRGSRRRGRRCRRGRSRGRRCRHRAAGAEAKALSSSRVAGSGVSPSCWRSCDSSRANRANAASRSPSRPCRRSACCAAVSSVGSASSAARCSARAARQSPRCSCEAASPRGRCGRAARGGPATSTASRSSRRRRGGRSRRGGCRDRFRPGRVGPIVDRAFPSGRRSPGTGPRRRRPARRHGAT